MCAGNPEGNLEDRRTAAGITVELSGQLMGASLAALGVAIAAWTYLADKRECGGLFLALCIGSFVSFVASIFVAGKGITAVRNQGFEGVWNKETAKHMFGFQAVLCLLALVLFLGSVFFGSKPKADESDERVRKLELRIEKLENDLAAKQRSGCGR